MLGEIRIRLLGPMSAELHGQQVAPSAAKQRQVLALLALNAGRVVTVPTLIEELWGDRPPRSLDTTLQTYILQLRNRLQAALPTAPPTLPTAPPIAEGAKRLLSTRLGGYLLDEAACQIDVDEFSRLARSGREAAESGDPAMASELLSSALRLWRGPALTDVRPGRVLELEVTSLEATRLGVLERRIQADLELGRHHDLLGELTVLTAGHPMNENFCALLMTALYRSGHVAGALHAFRRIRSVLIDELGVEPCPRLRRLQEAVLAGDPDLYYGQVPAPS
jgi:SARP family transcriptional regulator, regulator of embCAB operon